MSWMIYALLGVGIIVLIICIVLLTRRKHTYMVEGMLDYFNIEDYLKTLPTTQGRYIRIRPASASTSGDGYITFSQIQVYDMNGNNIAKNKTVYATSTASISAPVSSTVDGVEAPKSTAANVWTSGSTDRIATYWQLDLGSVQQIAEITCLGQADGDSSINARLKGMRVEILLNIESNTTPTVTRVFLTTDVTQTITMPNSINLTPEPSSPIVSPINPLILPINSKQPEVYALGPVTNSRDRAEFMCNAQGATLATSGQMEQAQLEGAEWCEKCWVKNSQDLVYYPMQISRTGCGSIGMNSSPASEAKAACFGIKPPTSLNGEILPFNSNGTWSQYTYASVYSGSTSFTVPDIDSINTFVSTHNWAFTFSTEDPVTPSSWITRRPDLAGNQLFSTLKSDSPLNFVYEEGTIANITSLNTKIATIKVFGTISDTVKTTMNESLSLCRRLYLGSINDVDKFINIKYEDLQPYIRPTAGYTKFCYSEIELTLNRDTSDYKMTLANATKRSGNTSNCNESLTTNMLGLLPYPARNFVINWIYNRTIRMIEFKFGATADAEKKKLQYMKATVGGIPIALDITNKYNLNIIGQSFYEAMGGNYIMSNIYDIYTIGGSILDIRFDLTKHADVSALQAEAVTLKEKYVKLRNSNVTQDILDTAKESYIDALSDIQEKQTDNTYPPVLGVVGRFFYTYDGGIFNITGFTLDARAVTSFIPELNCGIQVATGSDPGSLNYEPVIKYTLNTSEPLDCSNTETLKRIMEDYVDASQADLAKVLKDATPSMNTSLGTIKISQIIGATQVSRSQCAITWKETLWNDLSNTPIAPATTNITRNALISYSVDQDNWYVSESNLDAKGFKFLSSASVPECRFDPAKYKEVISSRSTNFTPEQLKTDYINNSFNNGKGNPCEHILPNYKFSPRDYAEANSVLQTEFKTGNVYNEVGLIDHYKTTGIGANLVLRAAQPIPEFNPKIDIRQPMPANNTLDNASKACLSTTCEDFKVLYNLADSYNSDPTAVGSILRITRAYTTNSFQCDVEADMNYDSMVEDTKGNIVKKGSFRVDDAGKQIAVTKSLPSGIKKGEKLALNVYMDSATCTISFSSSNGPGSGTAIQENTPALYKPMEYATEYQKVNTKSLSSSIDKVAKVVSDVASAATSILSTYRTETIAAVGNLAFLGTCPTAKCSDTVNLNTMLSYYKSQNQGKKQINTVLRVGTLDEQTCDLTFQEDTLAAGTTSGSYRIASSQTAGMRFKMSPGTTPCSFSVTSMSPVLPAPPPDTVNNMANKPSSAICGEVYGIGGYSYTPSTAAAKCASYGGVLATYKQLQAAQTSGADWCSTGWLADMSGTAYYPITTSIQAGCGGGSPGIKSYTPGTAGANCYGVKPKQGQYADVLPFAGSTWNQNQSNACGTLVNYGNPYKETFVDYGKPIQVSESTFPLNSERFGMARKMDRPILDNLFKEPLRQDTPPSEIGPQLVTDEAAPLSEKKATSYKYIRFRPTKTRYPMNPTVDVGKFRFFLGKNEIDVQNAKVTNPMGSWVGDIEDVVSKEYTRGWSDVNKKALVFAFPYAILLDGFTWTTANPDKGIGGDPVQWKLEGSQNGVYWTVLRNQTHHNYPVPQNRYQELPVFRF